MNGFPLRLFLAFFCSLTGLWMMSKSGDDIGFMLGVVVTSLGLAYVWSDRKQS